jgi:hypothetical protein
LGSNREEGSGLLDTLVVRQRELSFILRRGVRFQIYRLRGVYDLVDKCISDFMVGGIPFGLPLSPCIPLLLNI